MKRKLRDFFDRINDEFTHRLRLVCGKPSPMKRLVITLIIFALMSVIYCCIIVGSIMHDDELIHIKHIEQIKLCPHNDSIINELKNRVYEHEHSNE